MIDLSSHYLSLLLSGSAARVIEIEVTEDAHLIDALSSVEEVNAVYQLPFNAKFPVESADRYSGMLIMRKAHEDVWKIVKNNVLTRDCPVLIVVGPAGVGKVCSYFRLLFCFKTLL